MYDRTVEAQSAIEVARVKVLAALNAATRDGDALELSRHLWCLKMQLEAAQYVVASAVNAALVLKTVRAHTQPENMEERHAHKP